MLLDTERRITDAVLADISSGLLPAGTVLLSSRAPIGHLVNAEVPGAINQRFIAMMPRNGVSNLFLLCWSEAALDEIVSHANGSTFLEISKSCFRPTSVTAPPEPVMTAFDHVAQPLYRRSCPMIANLATTLRDALMPKLVSGELRVKDAECFSRRL